MVPQNEPSDSRRHGDGGTAQEGCPAQAGQKGEHVEQVCLLMLTGVERELQDTRGSPKSQIRPDSEGRCTSDRGFCTSSSRGGMAAARAV